MNTTYDTKDIYLSSYLISAGFAMDSFLRESGRTTFRFEQEETLAQHVNNFYADKAIVSALKYGNALKNLKALLYSKDTNTHANTYVQQSGKGN